MTGELGQVTNIVSVPMAMPVMKIGIVRMAVNQRLMPMPVAVRFPNWRIWAMRVLMVRVMSVPVLVFHRLVPMLVLVAFCQVKP